MGDWTWRDEEAYDGPLGDPDEGRPDPSEYAGDAPASPAPREPATRCTCPPARFRGPRLVDAACPDHGGTVRAGAGDVVREVGRGTA